MSGIFSAIGGIASIGADAVGLGIGHAQGEDIAEATAGAQKKQRDKLNIFRDEQIKNERERIRREQGQQKQAVALAGPSDEELAALDGMLEVRKQSEQNLERQIASAQESLKTIDPVIREAGKQQYQLMKGKEAASLGPFKRKQQLQRERFEQNMQRRLGPGWMTSTAGAQALSGFEVDQANALNDAQFKAIDQMRLSGLSATQQRSLLTQETERSFRNTADIARAEAAGRGAISQRKANAFAQTKVDFGINTGGFEAQIAGLEGDEETLEILKSQNIAQTARGASKLFGKTMGIGSNVVGGLFGGSGSTSTNPFGSGGASGGGASG